MFRAGLRIWGLLGLLLLAPVQAGDPTGSTRTAADERALSDCQRTLRARQALLRDEVLAPLNLGVSTRSGVVTLWGLVPDAAQAQRATERVRQVPGVLEVRNQLHIVPANDPLREFLARPGTNPTTPPAAEEPAAAQRPSGALTSRPAPPAGPAVAVLPPIALPARPVSAGSAPAAVLLQPPGTEAADLTAAVERLTHADPRFRWVRIEVQGGIVHLRGFIRRHADLFELARAISHLAGVQRVILEEVHPIPVQRPR